MCYTVLCSYPYCGATDYFQFHAVAYTVANVRQDKTDIEIEIAELRLILLTTQGYGSTANVVDAAICWITDEQSRHLAFDIEP
jgi:hypothetical protein